MERFSFEPIEVTTRMAPVEAHAAHLRHLARPTALSSFLQERHGLLGAPARRKAAEVAPFVEQGLSFHDASHTAPMRVRPVLQYYSYLNLAVAVVLVHQPPGWEGYRKHGAEDMTRKLQRISVSSPVVRVRTGALSLFHSILSDAALPSASLSLRQLLTAIPMVAAELDHVCGLKPLQLEVLDSVIVEGTEARQSVHSCFTFRLLAQNQPVSEGSNSTSRSQFPTRRLNALLPKLGEAYRCSSRSGGHATYTSKQRWTTGNRARAERYHDIMKLKFVNFGGHVPGESGDQYAWRLAPSIPTIPTLSAAMLLSFTLASLCRYRSNILDRVESSKVNLLCEVFTNEADGFIVPAMRNLLYADNMRVALVPFT